MCLGVPGLIIEKQDNTATVDIQTIKQKVNVSLVDVNIGDWVLIHAGFAINKIDKEDALETLDLLRQLDNVEVS